MISPRTPISKSDQACITLGKFVLLFMIAAPIFGVLANGSAQRADRSQEPNMSGELAGIFIVSALGIVPIASMFRKASPIRVRDSSDDSPS
jgi:hypothetical protein